MAVRLRLRNEIWWLDFRWNGERVRRSTGTTKKSLAEKLAKVVEARLLLGKPPFPEEPVDRITFETHADNWLSRVEGSVRPHTLHVYDQAIREAKPLIGKKPVAEVTRAHALTVVRELSQGKGGQRARKTVSNLVGALQSAFEDAVSVQHLAPKNPFANKAQLLKAAGFRPDRASAAATGPQPYTIHERDRFLALMKKEDFDLYVGALLGLRAGLRRSEVLGLRHEDVDLEGRYLHVRRRYSDGQIDDPKTQRSRRTVPLSQELADVLVEYRARNAKRGESPWVFPSIRLKDGIQDDRRYGDRFIRKIRKAKITGHPKPFHDLRHTFATDLLLAGVPILKVSRWLGHTSIQITCDTYGHLLPDPGEHGVVDALDQLTAVTFGHDLVTRADDDDFGDIDDDANYADLKGESWHAGRDSNPRPSGSKPDALSS